MRFWEKEPDKDFSPLEQWIMDALLVLFIISYTLVALVLTFS